MFANSNLAFANTVRKNAWVTAPDPIWLRPESAGVGRPAEHTRADVTAAAIAVAESDGFAAVSMRRVAARLGTGPASLYRYVRNRGELLQLMADSVYREMRLERTARGGRADLVEVGLEGFRVTLAHPWFVDLLAEPSFLAGGPGVARLAEHCLALMADDPIPGHRKMETIGVISGMVHLIATFAVRQDFPEMIAAQTTYLAHVAQDGQHPHLAAVFASAPPAEDATPQTAEQGLGQMLALILDGVLGPDPDAVR